LFKKTVTYKDYNGDEQTDTYWFHLSEDEVTVIEYEAVTDRTLGLADMIEKIVKDMKGKEMIGIITNLVEKAYGIRSTDGKRFIKTPELYEEFKSTAGYSKFFFELVTNADTLVEWFNGLLPENLAELAEDAKRRAYADEAETARKRSEALMQGFQKKAEKVTVTNTPELGTEAPVLETEANVENTPSARPDLWPEADPELEAFRAWKARQAEVVQQ